MNNLGALAPTFTPVLQILDAFIPSAIAIVGSRGDSTKSPDEFSDTDLIYVFDSRNILYLLGEIQQRLAKIVGLHTVYLGVHFQFGHVLSAFFESQPLCWIDIGLMDQDFAANYLVGLPMTVVHGSVPTCGLPTNPRNQMQHLARKLLKANLRNNSLHAVNCAFRYLNWLEVENRNTQAACNSERLPTQNPIIGDGHKCSSKPKRGDSSIQMDTIEVIHKVMEDIRIRFPELKNALSILRNTSQPTDFKNRN